MSKATHTPGLWAVEDVSDVARQIYVTATDHRRGTPFIVALVYQKTPADQAQPEDVATNMANAALIAESLNVARETGLTPRQLAEQRERLLACLKGCRDELLTVAAEMGEGEESIPALYRANAAIADAEGGTP